MPTPLRIVALLLFYGRALAEHRTFLARPHTWLETAACDLACCIADTIGVVRYSLASVFALTEAGIVTRPHTTAKNCAGSCAFLVGNTTIIPNRSAAQPWIWSRCWDHRGSGCRRECGRRRCWQYCGRRHGGRDRRPTSGIHCDVSTVPELLPKGLILWATRVLAGCPARSAPRTPFARIPPRFLHGLEVSEVGAVGQA